MSTAYDELLKLINSISGRKQNDSSNSRNTRKTRRKVRQSPYRLPLKFATGPREWNAEPAGLASNTDANRCPFNGPRCWWPCPPSCQCPGECPMDVTETDEQIGVGTMYVDRFQRDGQQYAWPGNTQNGGYPGQNPTDFPAVYGQFGVETQGVDRYQFTDQQYAWPRNAQNGVYPQQFWTDVAITYAGQCPTDFPAVQRQFGVETQDVGQVPFTGSQYVWPGNTQNVVCPEQNPTYVPAVYGQVDVSTREQVGVETQVVSRSQATDPQYAWPDNAQNVASPEQYWTDVVQMEANANTSVYSFTESEESLFGSCSDTSDEVYQISEIVRVE